MKLRRAGRELANDLEGWPFHASFMVAHNAAFELTQSVAIAASSAIAVDPRSKFCHECLEKCAQVHPHNLPPNGARFHLID
jgi:hypothetical protein